MVPLRQAVLAMSDLNAPGAPLLSEIRYDELVVGRRFGPYIETIGAALADRLRNSIGVTQAGRLVGPGVFPVLFLKVLRRSMGGALSQTVLAKQELEFHAPLQVDSQVRCETWVSDKYVRRGRRYSVVEFEIRNAENELALTGRKVIVWPEAPS